jgi:beta propeller domain-containing protein
MRIRPLLPVLSLLTLATSAALAQHGPSPKRTMRPFRSEAELLQFFAVLDRERPARVPPAASCADSTAARKSRKDYVITGRVRSSTGDPVGNALVIPRKRVESDTLIVSAAFMGYRRAVQTITLRRKTARTDFVLKESPAQLQEMAVTAQTADAGAAKRDESITNTQHAGVDEGGIVKLHGDHLVVLRRGRLFTVSVRDAELRPVAMIDAFPPGADPAEWYDELLISGDRVIVIGYSYRRGGTEVGLFAIDRKGDLRHLSTSHLRSWDYYSSRNYASRLIGNKLIYYTPLPLRLGTDPLAQLPALREWRPGAGPDEFERIVTPRRVYRPARSLAGSEDLTLHTITQCDVGGPGWSARPASSSGPTAGCSTCPPARCTSGPPTGPGMTATPGPRARCCTGCRWTVRRRTGSPSGGAR